MVLPKFTPAFGPLEHGPAQPCSLPLGRARGSPRCDKDRLEAGLCPPVLVTACSPARFLSGFTLTWALFFPGAQILSGGRMLSLPTPHLLDSGTYTCVASSAVGEDRREATVEVRCKCPQPLLGAAPCPLPSLGGCGVSHGKRGLGVALPCLFPVPPTAPGEEENVSAIVNQEVTLRCPAPGVDPQGSRWLKDGTLLTLSPGMSLSEDGTVLQVMFWGKRRDGREKRVQSISPSLLVAGGASRHAGCGQVHMPGARPPGETLQPERVG